MKKGLILINAYLKLQSQFSQAQRMQAELEALGIATEIKRNDGFFAVVADNEIRSSLQKEYDFCVYFDKDKYMSEMLEKLGLRLFNRHEAIRICDDKMQTYISLTGKNIPMVKTLSGLLCYEPSEKVRLETAERIEKELGYPVIIKESFGSLGKGVYMAKDRTELLSVMEELKCRPHLFQRAVTSSLGKDLRVILVGGKVVAAMLRQSKTDFRSNIELGGVGSPYSVSYAVQTVCERVAQEIGLDYCGIDILFGARGEPIVCEVNSNAFFGGIERVTGVNVAKTYARHIYDEIYGAEKTGENI